MVPADFRARLTAGLARPAADGLAVLAGGLFPLAFAPFHLYPLALLALLVLFLLWLDASPRRAMWRGFLFGLGQFGVGVSWVYVAIHDFGYSGVPLAVFLTSLFVAFLALFPALLGYVCARFLRAPDTWRLALLFPAAWTLWEWIRGWILTGFPWLNVGYSLIDAPLSGIAPLFGVYGMSLAASVSAGLLAFPLRNTTVRQRGTALAAFAGLWLGAWALTAVSWTEPKGPPIKVALVQGNVPQDTKWRPDLVTSTQNLYADLTRQHWDRQLIVWPEAAITVFYDEVAGSYLAGLRREARSHGTDIVLGIPVREPGTRRYFNSLLSLSDHPGFYHKRHLVPFGDYVPLQEWLRGLIRFFDLPMSGFSPGPSSQPLLEAAGQKIAGTVCYEDVFGEELIPSLPAASLLINATNNAWYGDSLAPHQHLQMSRLRALETGRMLLRATTNGVSAIVDTKGRILARSRQFVTTVLTGEVVPYRGSTPYVRWGNAPVLVLILVVLVAGVWRSRAGAARPGRGVQ